jgi:preprotein translocase subunit SecF
MSQARHANHAKHRKKIGKKIFIRFGIVFILVFILLFIAAFVFFEFGGILKSGIEFIGGIVQKVQSVCKWLTNYK